MNNLTHREYLAWLLHAHKHPNEFQLLWLCTDEEYQTEMLQEADRQLKEWAENELLRQREREAGPAATKGAR